ncbi:hypothetical protein PanWU01x14_128320, partial [Parasponia andersonii]
EIEIKELSRLKYFLSIEVAHSQQKYVLDLLTEVGKLGCKLVETPTEQNHKLSEAPEDAARNKKQNVVARSSAKAEFMAMVLEICELLWLKIILEDLKITWEGPMKLHCNNKSAVNIAHNPMQHDRTKHVEVDRHFIKEKLESGLICTPFVSSKKQLADVLIKGLNGSVYQSVITKLGMDNIHSLA